MNESNNLRTFKYDAKKIRTINIGGHPRFIGNDVSKILDYKNYRDALNKHVDEDDKLRMRIPYGDQNRRTTLINEAGVYSLIFGSELPSARKFKRWVMHEVLPSLRKYGNYDLSNNKAVVTKKVIITRDSKRILYSDVITSTVLARMHNMTAQQLHKFLQHLGIIYKDKYGVWQLCEAYKGCNLVRYERFKRMGGCYHNWMKWIIDPGAQFIHNKLNNHKDDLINRGIKNFKYYDLNSNKSHMDKVADIIYYSNVRNNDDKDDIPTFLNN